MTTQEPTPGAGLRGGSRGKRLRLAVRLVQRVLAVRFAITGVLKLTGPIPALARILGWPGTVPAGLVRFIGLAELAGAIGLVLPALTGIKPALTGWAAVGLGTVMVLATLFHLSRGERGPLPVTLVLGALAMVVAWGQARMPPLPVRA
jgi:putative oxidoreductase